MSKINRRSRGDTPYRAGHKPTQRKSTHGIISHYGRLSVVYQEVASNKIEAERCISPNKIKDTSDLLNPRERVEISFEMTAAQRRATVCRTARASTDPILQGFMAPAP